MDPIIIILSDSEAEENFEDNSSVISITDDEDNDVPTPHITHVEPMKNEGIIQKLINAQKILQAEVKRLEATEIVSDQMSELTFMKLDKMKTQMIKQTAAIAKLSGNSQEGINLKSIPFKHTDYPEFNKKVKKMINNTKHSPDYYSILKSLDFCNRKFGYKLEKSQIETIAQDAFKKVGEKLQKRRKLELEEALSYFDTNEKDPGLTDQDLSAKLEENKRIGKLNMDRLFEPKPEDKAIN